MVGPSPAVAHQRSGQPLRSQRTWSGCGRSASATALHRNAIAEPCTGNGSASARGAAASIAMAATGGKVERTYGGDIRPGAAVHVSWNSIRITESAGLHFAGSNLLQGRSRRTSTEGIGGNNPAVPWAPGRVFNTLESNFGAERPEAAELRQPEHRMHALRLPKLQYRRLNPGATARTMMCGGSILAT